MAPTCIVLDFQFAFFQIFGTDERAEGQESKVL